MYLYDTWSVNSKKIHSKKALGGNEVERSNASDFFFAAIKYEQSLSRQSFGRLNGKRVCERCEHWSLAHFYSEDMGACALFKLDHSSVQLPIEKGNKFKSKFCSRLEQLSIYICFSRSPPPSALAISIGFPLHFPSTVELRIFALRSSYYFSC